MSAIWSGNGKRIYMQEVGTRDGLQSEPAFVPTADKIALAGESRRVRGCHHAASVLHVVGADRTPTDRSFVGPGTRAPP